jgi:hypothetical protein
MILEFDITLALIAILTFTLPVCMCGQIVGSTDSSLDPAESGSYMLSSTTS